MLSVAGTLVRGSIDLLVGAPTARYWWSTTRRTVSRGRDPAEIVAATRSSATSTRWPRPPGARRSRPRTCSSSGRTSRRSRELRRGRAGGGPGPDGDGAGEARGRPLRGHRPRPTRPSARLPGAGAPLQPQPAARCGTTPIRRSSRAPMTSLPMADLSSRCWRADDPPRPLRLRLPGPATRAPR